MRKAFMLAVLGGMLVTSAGAFAADNPTTVGASEVAAIRAKIKAQDFKGAIRDLNWYIDSGIQNADLYNLLGFSLRKTGDLARAAPYYQKALSMEPNHKGALEYQGELFLQTGNRSGAEANLARLRQLCPSGCEELRDLDAAIKAAPRS